MDRKDRVDEKSGKSRSSYLLSPDFIQPKYDLIINANDGWDKKKILKDTRLRVVRTRMNKTFRETIFLVVIIELQIPGRSIPYIPTSVVSLN